MPTGPEATERRHAVGGHVTAGLNRKACDTLVPYRTGRLAVRRWGRVSSARRVVFLLHGTPGCRLSVFPGEDQLDDLGICVVTYDRPGYGSSDPAVAPRRVADAATEVATIADHFGYGTFGVVGRSGGGPHGLACGALLADRVTRVACLAGLAPFDAAGLEWTKGMTAANVVHYAEATKGREAVLRYVTELIREMRSRPANLLSRTSIGAGGVDRETLEDPTYKDTVLRGYFEAIQSPEGWTSDTLAFTGHWGFSPATVTVPTWLWQGEKDLFVPASHAKWLAARIPGAKLALDPAEGHFGALKQQDRAIRWAAGLYPDYPELAAVE